MPPPIKQTSLSPSKLKTSSKGLRPNSPLSPYKKSLIMRRSPVNEKMMLPKTGDKMGITKRILFRRRERMRDKNLILIYYEGVMGEN